MNISVLNGVVPNKVIAELPSVMERFDINTPHRVAHFLGQCHHESGGFRHVFENLNYSAEALLRVFPSKFKDPYEVEFYAGRPMHIADRVYGGRMGNGPPPSGDGWKYRGRGYIQLTGKNNYAAFDKFVDDDILENPDLVATKYPLYAAGWFWKARLIDRFTGSLSNTAIMKVTKLVNGGSHGLANRKAITIKVYNTLIGKSDG